MVAYKDPNYDRFVASKEIRYSDYKTRKNEIKQFLAWGVPIEKLFNTSGILYRKLLLKDKLPKLTEEEKISLLSSNGMLVKRPLLIVGKRVLVGFKEQEWKEIVKEKEK